MFLPFLLPWWPWTTLLLASLPSLHPESALASPGPGSWARGAATERRGQGGGCGIPRDGRVWVRCHSPHRVARFHACSVSLVSFWPGWAWGNWLPLVHVGDLVLTETAGVINCLVSSGYCAKADSSSGMCGVGRGHPVAAELVRMAGRKAGSWLSGAHTQAGACASVRRSICRGREHQRGPRPVHESVRVRMRKLVFRGGGVDMSAGVSVSVQICMLLGCIQGCLCVHVCA